LSAFMATGDRVSTNELGKRRISFCLADVVWFDRHPFAQVSVLKSVNTLLKFI
jgi:hypothetical protein